LKFNEAKSAVARPEERKFLGFSISSDGRERRIAPEALERFKMRIRDMTPVGGVSAWRGAATGAPSGVMRQNEAEVLWSEFFGAPTGASFAPDWLSVRRTYGKQ